MCLIDFLFEFQVLFLLARIVKLRLSDARSAKRGLCYRSVSDTRISAAEPSICPASLSRPTRYHADQRHAAQIRRLVQRKARRNPRDAADENREKVVQIVVVDDRYRNHQLLGLPVLVGEPHLLQQLRFHALLNQLAALLRVKPIIRGYLFLHHGFHITPRRLLENSPGLDLRNSFHHVRVQWSGIDRGHLHFLHLRFIQPGQSLRACNCNHFQHKPGTFSVLLGPRPSTQTRRCYFQPGCNNQMKNSRRGDRLSTV